MSLAVTEVLALTGGVGGAKLALGLQALVPDGRLACLVNTGDDFRHLGLHISPDIDTLLYTLSGGSNEELGWGRRDETWTFMQVLEELGGPAWFRLGDGDLALHVDRTRRLAAGATLTAVTAHLARAMGLTTRVLPMTDEPVATRVHTDAGVLEFQEYFVARRAAPRVQAIEFAGAAAATLGPDAHAAFTDPALEAIVLCPSNPYLSIDPLLAVPTLRAALATRTVPAVAVCPLIGGQAVKGPTAKIMAELGVAADPAAIAAHYAGLIDGLVIDTADADFAHRCGVPTLVTGTYMKSLEDRVALAAATLGFAASLRAPE